jgi:hypothetical protein
MDRDLFERATCRFKQPLDVTQFRDLAFYLAARSSYRIVYTSRQTWIIERATEERGSAGVEGMISKVNCGHLTTFPFESFRDDGRRYENYHTFDGIRLILPQGDSANDLDSRDLAEIDKLRMLVGKYKLKK